MEDKVQYFIFPSAKDDCAKLLEDMQKFVKPLINGYIWDLEEFKLEIRNRPILGSFLFGSLLIGDTLEDEWLAVYLLFKISEAYPHLVIHVSDQDGEFLLIEAADYIPDWLDPENSENRIFICKGKLCILPINQFPKMLLLKTAIETVRADPFAYFASKEVQECIKKRITRFEGDKSRFLHRANAIVPIWVAAILKENPSLISKALTAFANRGDKPIILYKPDAVKVETLVTFSRTQYAKLAWMPFFPPKEYPMPTTADNISPTTYLKFDRGFKLAAAFSMIRSSINIPSDLDEGNPQKYAIEGKGESDLWLEIDPEELEENPNAHLIDPEDFAEAVDAYKAKEKLKKENRLNDDIDGIQSFMEKMSFYEGIDMDSADDYDEDEDSNDEDEDEESDYEDEDFIELEILETLKHDPDLLMRIIEMNAHSGFDNDEIKTLMEKMQKLTEKATSSGTRKKGLADIDPAKLEEARRRPDRKLPDEVERQNQERAAAGDEEDSEDDDMESSDEDFGDVVEKTPTLQDLYKSVPKKEIFIEDDVNMQDYMDEMDAELAGKLNAPDFSITSDKGVKLTSELSEIDIKYNLAKSIVEVDQMKQEAGERGPSNTLLSSLSIKK